jgi:hypothetical protein
MIFTLIIIVLFVGISIYFFFKAEALQRQILLFKREATTLKKESKLLIDSMAVIAKRNEEFVKRRIKQVAENKEKTEGLILLHSLSHSYSTIFIASAKGKGQLHKIVKKCCEGYEAGSYKKLTSYIANQDQQIKRFWGSNNLNGYIALIETLLEKESN